MKAAGGLAMGTRGRLSAAIGVVILGCATYGVSVATAAPGWTASVESVAADKKQSTPTPTQPSAIGDELIYDFVGPNTAEKPALRTR